jgi:hypothetical protein
MKKIHVALLLLLLPLCANAQEKAPGLAYIDSINMSMQSTALELAMLECLPESDNGELEIVPIGSTYFCIVRCIANDKLFQFEYESNSWINIPLPSLQDPEVTTIRKVKSLFAENGNILITLHWSGAEIRGYDDERPYVYEDKTFTLSYLQQLVKK